MFSWKPFAGVGPVPPNETHAKTVVFICHKDCGSIEPIGTGFLVQTQSSPGGSWWTYLITAKHLVEDGGERWVRFRKTSDTVTDEVAGEWVKHPKSDIAATVLDFNTSKVMFDAIETDWFYPKYPGMGAELIRGQTAYFMGLLQDVPGMGERNTPMLRGGVIGALYQERIPMRDVRSDGTTYQHEEPLAHLIDCYSRGGFSGAPVWAEGPRRVPGMPEAMSMTGYVTLIGVIVGHFGSVGDNAGIAVAVPSEAILELLEDPRLTTAQQQKESRMEDKRKARVLENAAQLDRGGAEESEFNRFEVLTKQLVQVPKTDVGAERKDEGSS